jgi:DNA polymerase III delta prime subunit
MIGQENNKKLIDNFIENNSCPRFIIITGTEGSSKRTFSKYIADKLNAEFMLFDNKVESIRNVITTAYTQNKNMLYCVYGYETMSIAAKNALLKIAEEPPTNTYVILTATNKNEILTTLTSRAVVIDMEEYSNKELEECADLFGITKNNIELCEVPLDIVKLQDINQEEFKEFLENVWEKIGTASIGNALKLTNKLKLKDEQEGYDVILFINGIGSKVTEKLLPPRNGKMLTTKHNLEIGREILELCYTTKNRFNSKYSKQALLDNFIIDLRNLRNGII